MMSYTMLCTSLCDSGGMLMRFMSPSTRIMGGTPEDRCRSDALFLTANASSCAISTAMKAPGRRARGNERRDERATSSLAWVSIAEGFHVTYVNESAEFAGSYPGDARTHRSRRGPVRPECRLDHTPCGEQGPAGKSGARGRR